jgi:hypothetical protein
MLLGSKGSTSPLLFHSDQLHSVQLCMGLCYGLASQAALINSTPMF